MQDDPQQPECRNAGDSGARDARTRWDIAATAGRVFGCPAIDVAAIAEDLLRPQRLPEALWRAARIDQRFAFARVMAMTPARITIMPAISMRSTDSPASATPIRTATGGFT